MSSSIWTRCGARSNVRRLGGRAIRIVEGQHVVATRRLVDSLEEHEILERLIDGAKPPLPETDEFRGLHYLLATPFRYPPLRHGSRFGTRAERSLWYGSASLRTACAETAFYRLLFLAGTAADLGVVTAEFSSFHVPLRTARGVDLCRAPFERHRAAIAAPDDYAPTQQLGREMRTDGVVAFRYPSARDVRGGVNVGLFSPRAFAAREPSLPQAWHCTATPARVEFVRKDVFERRAFAFARAEFELDGRLPAPAG